MKLSINRTIAYCDESRTSLQGFLKPWSSINMTTGLQFYNSFNKNSDEYGASGRRALPEGCTQRNSPPNLLCHHFGPRTLHPRRGVQGLDPHGTRRSPKPIV
jgi:hypothetical protein